MTDAVMLQERVRADRHATSYPLIVIGAVGVHYASSTLASSIRPVYGVPLAFVVVWALQWRNERRTGVGTGNDDALLVAFGVFLLVSLFQSASWQTLVSQDSSQFDLLWVLSPAGIGLAAIGVRQRNRTLVAWGGCTVAALVLGDLLDESYLQLRDSAISYVELIPQLAFLAVTVAGALAYRRERAISES